MAIKKSELYSSLWKSCDELRGGMDASQYKDYVLTFLFVKYVSDKYAEDSNATIKVPMGGSFADIVALKGANNIGDQVNKIINRLAEENDLKGVIDMADFNAEEKLGSGKEMVDRLTNFIQILEAPELNLVVDSHSASTVYEDLIRHCSCTGDMRIGDFYTPLEVNQLVAKVLGISKIQTSGVTIYDPACGYGSLLLQVAKEAGNNVTLHGQEINATVSSHAQMNMIIHGAETANIARGNVLSSPKFLVDGDLERFDYVVAHPPFSLRNWDAGFDPEHDQFNRFQFGVPAKQQGDFAFIQHMIASLKPEGRMAVLIPHGALFRGGADSAIRQSILEADLVEAVIGLPANLLSHTRIPLCLLICNKQKAKDRSNKVLFINADRDFFKTRRKNILLPEHIEKIADTFDTYSDIERFSREVSLDEIRDNAFNLNISRYVDSSELSVLLKQHCDAFDKYLIKDLALEINPVGSSRYEEKPNSFFVSRMNTKMHIPTTDLSAVDEKMHKHYFQVVLNEKAINHYVVQFLHSTIGQLALAALARGSITPFINRASLNEVLIALPDMEHQKASIETHRKLSILRESIENISQDLSLNPTLSTEFEAQLDSMLSAVGQLSDADQIRSVIRQGESKTVEFKETYSLCLRKKTKETYVEIAALKTIVAFLNSEGGTLLVGVNDNSEIVGVGPELDAFYKKDNDYFLKHLKNNLKARIGEQFYPFIDHELIEVDGFKLVRFQCTPSDHPCYLDGKDFYVRTNPASDKIEGPTLVEYVSSHFGK